MGLELLLLSLYLCGLICGCFLLCSFVCCSFLLVLLVLFGFLLGLFLIGLLLIPLIGFVLDFSDLSLRVKQFPTSLMQIAL
ncbi:hypothetical protein CI601_02260 [Bifidobacterium sp. wkB344]|nr:hypothetical protein CI601_02260 [Bifidobacterium sp. wkB344]